MTKRTRSGRRLGRPVAVGAALERGLAPTARKHGFSETRLLLRWESVVGAEVAAWTRPLRLFRGVLHLRVASAWAPYVQHQAPSIRDRVNLFLGRKAVARIALKQGLVVSPPRRNAGPGAGPRARCGFRHIRPRTARHARPARRRRAGSGEAARRFRHDLRIIVSATKNFLVRAPCSRHNLEIGYYILL